MFVLSKKRPYGQHEFIFYEAMQSTRISLIIVQTLLALWQLGMAIFLDQKIQMLSNELVHPRKVEPQHETTCRKLLRQDKGGKATEIYKALRTETWREKEQPSHWVNWFGRSSYFLRRVDGWWFGSPNGVVETWKHHSVFMCILDIHSEYFLGWKTIWIQLDF